MANHRRKPIAISNVATYSFSQFDDGTYGFWAAGRAGWFELKSAAPSYQPVFKGMSEATGMFYYLADNYKSVKKQLRKEAIKVQEAYVMTVFNEVLLPRLQSPFY